MKRFRKNLLGILANTARFAWAAFVTYTWSPLRFCAFAVYYLDWPLGVLWKMAWQYGRRESPWPTVCKDCGYCTMERYLVHTYCDDCCGDVEPVDECNMCGSENVARIGDR